MIDRDNPGGVRGRARLMEFMTFKEVSDGLAETQTVIVPVGCTEQHGWHLPLSMDIYNAYEVAKRVSEATGVFVAPVMPYSFSGGTFPGTINIAPQTVSAVINDICLSLASQGFKNIIILLGHEGSENRRGIKDGLEVFLKMNPAMKEINIALASAILESPTVMEWFARKDFHAGAVETSLMLYWHPELVKDTMVTDSEEVLTVLKTNPDAYQRIERRVDDPLVFPHVTQSEKIKVGVMGYPSEASREIGEKVVKEVVSRIISLVERMENAK